MTQEPYRGFSVPADEFAANPSQRLPCVLLLDTSSSMAGEPIAQLNAALVQYRDELLADTLASNRVDVAIFRFGDSVELERDFATARHFDPPVLKANGPTPMAEAIVRSIKHLEERKATYRANGVSYYRPWIFMITDGDPTDTDAAWKLACEAVKLGEQQKKFVFFSVGTASAKFEKLRELGASMQPVQLKGVAFRELFSWLSGSQYNVSRSQIGTSIQLPSHNSWGEVPT